MKAIERVFGKNRFEETKQIYEAWWEQKNDRPVAGFWVKNRQPDLQKPKAPFLAQENCNQLQYSADEILDAIEYEMCSRTYYGDAYPMYSMDSFGPGIIAAILGAELDNHTGNVWFHPKKIQEPDELHFEFDRENVWFQRILSIMKRATERFEGSILLSMPDLGSPLDLLSTFRPGENLLFDLYDYPEEVIRLSRELYEIWHVIYREFAKALNAEEFGYTDWGSIYSRESSYTIQCDFCYMIGEEMFHQFVYEDLKRYCLDLKRTVYHLDGPGEVKHLPDILKIKELGAVQWIPGDGNPTCEHYPELYQAIDKSEKQIQIAGQGLDKMLMVAEQISTPNRLQHAIFGVEKEGIEKNLYLLEKLGIPYGEKL